MLWLADLLESQPPTGEPSARDWPARFGGRGDLIRRPYPYYRGTPLRPIQNVQTPDPAMNRRATFVVPFRDDLKNVQLQDPPLADRHSVRISHGAREMRASRQKSTCRTRAGMGRGKTTTRSLQISVESIANVRYTPTRDVQGSLHIANSHSAYPFSAPPLSHNFDRHSLPGADHFAASTRARSYRRAAAGDSVVP